jgi:hypothetical protein
MSLMMVLYYCDMLFELYPSSLCFLTTTFQPMEASSINWTQQSRFHLMTREELSLEKLWLKNIRTMDKVQITDRSNTVSIFRAEMLKMETVCFSESLVSTYESTQHHNPEEQYRHPEHCENLKSHMI